MSLVHLFIVIFYYRYTGSRFCNCNLFIEFDDKIAVTVACQYYHPCDRTFYYDIL